MNSGGVSTAVMRVLLELASKGFVEEAKVVADSLEELADEAEEAAEETEKLGRKSDLTKRLLKGLAKTATAAALAVAAIFVAGIGPADDYSTALTQIVTLVGEAREQVLAWGDDLLRIGPAVRKGPQELAEALFVINSAGLKGAAAMDLVAEAGKASALGLGQTSEIARVATSAVLAYGEANLDVGDAVAQLLATVREGNLEASSLAPVLGRVIPMASQLGVGFGEVGAFIATFTKLGVDAATSTTSLSAVLNLLYKTSAEGEQILAQQNLSLEELRRQASEEGLASTLVGLIKAFEGNEVALTRVIPNIRAFAGVLGTAAAQGETLLEVERRVSQATRQLTQDAFELQELDPGTGFQSLSSALESAHLALSAGLTDALGGLASQIADFVNENLDTWKAWGRTVGSIAEGVIGGLLKIAEAVAWVSTHFDSLLMVASALIGVGLVTYLRTVAVSSQLAAIATLEWSVAVNTLQAGYGRVLAMGIAAKIKGIGVALKGLLAAIGPLGAVAAGLAAIGVAADAAWGSGAARRDQAAIAAMVEAGEQYAQIAERVSHALESGDRDTLSESLADLQEQLAATRAEVAPSLDELALLQRQLEHVQSAEGYSDSERQGFLAQISARIAALREETMEVGVLERAVLALQVALDGLVDAEEEQARARAQSAASRYLQSLQEETALLQEQLAALRVHEVAYQRVFDMQAARQQLIQEGIPVADALVSKIADEAAKQRTLNAEIEREIDARKRQQEMLASIQTLEIDSGMDDWLALMEERRTLLESIMTAEEAVSVAIEESYAAAERLGLTQSQRNRLLEQQLLLVSQVRGLDLSMLTVAERRAVIESQIAGYRQQQAINSKTYADLVAESLAHAEALNLSEEQRLTWLASQADIYGLQNEALVRQQELIDELQAGLQGIIEDQLSQMFVDLVPQAEGVFGEILSEFGRMLARMAAQAAAAGIAKAIFGGGGGAGGAAASAGSSLASSATSAGLSAAAKAVVSNPAIWAAAVPAAMYIAASLYSKNKWGKRYGFGAGATFDSNLGTSGGLRYDTEGDELADALQGTMDQIMGILGDSVTSLGRIVIMARNDGKAFKAYASGELIGTFRDAREAISRAVVSVFSAGELANQPELQTALRASAGATAEQLVKNLETAIALRDRGLSDAVISIRNAMDEAWPAAMRFAQSVVEAGFAMDEAAGTLASSLRGIRDQITGAQPDEFEIRLGQRSVFNERLAEYIRRLTSELEEKRRTLESFLANAMQGTGEIVTGVLDNMNGIANTFSDTVEAGSQALTNGIGAGGVGMISAQGAIDRLRDQIRYLEGELAALPDPISESEIRPTGTGSGRRQAREDFQDRIWDILNQTDSSVLGNVRGVLDQVEEIQAEAKRLGIEDWPRISEATSKLIGQLREDFDSFVADAWAAAGQSRFPTKDEGRPDRIPREMATAYLAMEQQLQSIRDETAEWRTALLEAEETLGETIGQIEALETAERLRLQALGEDLISGLGLPMDQVRQRVGQVAATIQFLRTNQDALSISAERFAEVVRGVGEQGFATIAGGLLDLIGDEEQFAETRGILERRLFEARIAQYRLEFELLAAQGVFLEDELRMMEELFSYIDTNLDSLFDRATAANDNVAPSLPSSVITSFPDDPVEAARAFMEQLAAMSAQAETSPLQQIYGEMDILRDRAFELRPALAILGHQFEDVVAQIDALEAARIAEIFDQALDPLRSIQDSLTFGGLSSLNPRAQFENTYADAQRLLEQALPSNTNEEQRLAAIQQLQGLMPELLSQAGSILDPTALLSFNDFIRETLSQITGYTPGSEIQGPRPPDGEGPRGDLTGIDALLAGGGAPSGVPPYLGGLTPSPLGGSDAAVREELRVVQAELRKIRAALEVRRADAAEQVDRQIRQRRVGMERHDKRAAKLERVTRESAREIRRIRRTA